MAFLWERSAWFLGALSASCGSIAAASNRTISDGAEATVYLDLSAFQGAVPGHLREGFDALAPGLNAPFVAGQLSVGLGTATVLDSLLVFGHSGLFMGAGSPPNFVLNNNLVIDLVWADPQLALGLTLQCFACDAAANPSVFTLEFFNDAGASIATISQPLLLDFTPHFLGARLSQTFSRARVDRSNPGNYLFDDVRSLSDRIHAGNFE